METNITVAEQQAKMDMSAEAVARRERAEKLRDAAMALLAEIEAWQKANPYCDGLFLPRGHDKAYHYLWEAGLIVPGSRTSGPGAKLGWYSVRLIDADHAEALATCPRRTLDPSVLKLALMLYRAYTLRYEAYLADCERDRRNGHRAHYCEHGTNQWTDYDNICGPCEDGFSLRDPMARRTLALESAKARVEEANGMLAWACQGVRWGMSHAISVEAVTERMDQLLRRA